MPENARAFNDVWRTFVTTAGVLFQTEQRRSSAGPTTPSQVIRPASRFNRASLVDGQLYLTMPESGLNVLEGDAFRPLPGTAALAARSTPSCSATTNAGC